MTINIHKRGEGGKGGGAALTPFTYYNPLRCHSEVRNLPIANRNARSLPYDARQGFMHNLAEPTQQNEGITCHLDTITHQTDVITKEVHAMIHENGALTHG